jgi:hypothetical protein
MEEAGISRMSKLTAPYEVPTNEFSQPAPTVYEIYYLQGRVDQATFRISSSHLIIQNSLVWFKRDLLAHRDTVAPCRVCLVEV